MMTEDIKRRMQQSLVIRVLEGDGKATREDRRAAFDNTVQTTSPLATLINKVAKYAYKVTNADVAAVKEAGLSEDQIFELVICAAVGQATRQYESALAALATATGKE